MHDIRLFMELVSYTMTAEVAHNTVVVFLRMFLNGMTDIAYKAIRFGGLGTNLQTLLGHTHQLFLFRGSLTNDEHPGGISIVSVQTGGAIHVDDIPLFEYIISLGNTMAHHLVDTRADTLGESLVVQRSRRGAMRNGIVMYDFIDFQRTHSRMNLRSHLVQNARIHHTGLSYSLNLLSRLDQIPCRNQLSFSFPVHHLLVKLSQRLTRNHMPSSLFHTFILYYTVDSFQIVINLARPVAAVLRTEGMNAHLSSHGNVPRTVIYEQGLFGFDALFLQHIAEEILRRLQCLHPIAHIRRIEIMMNGMTHSIEFLTLCPVHHERIRIRQQDESVALFPQLLQHFKVPHGQVGPVAQPAMLAFSEGHLTTHHFTERQTELLCRNLPLFQVAKDTRLCIRIQLFLSILHTQFLEPLHPIRMRECHDHAT